MSSQPGRRVKPEPVETTTRSSRRFATQPVEITSRSTRTPGLSSDLNRLRRKLAPQPVEMPRAGSKNKTKDDNEAAGKPKRRFAPQLVEESTTVHRKQDNVPPESPASEANDGPASCLSAAEPSRRKFAPQLIETAQRSRKAGDTKPALLPSDKTDAHSPQDTMPCRRPDVYVAPIPPPPLNTPNPSSPVTPLPSTSEARRLGIPLPKCTVTRDSMRQHSFRVPTLDPIESSESDKSDTDSLSTSLSSSSTDMSSSFRSYAHATRIRESVDDSSAGYLLELAARAAERQLREQALAAFPNDDRHTPVTHYIDRDSAESTRVNSRMGTGPAFHRRDSGFTKTDGQYAEMRRHQEKREAERGKERAAREARKRKMMRQQQHHNGDSTPWANPLLMIGAPKDVFANDMDSDVEMA